jgi:hypothetical protein
MQPYLFPYLGYWQLLAAVDTFVNFDDVNFIKRGWINRNNILVGGRAHMFTLPLCGASQNRLINEIEISPETSARQGILKTIEYAYKKAPCFADAFPLVESIMNYEESNLALFLHNHFHKILNYLDINTTLLLSSEIKKNNVLKAQDKIIDICGRLGATHYLNPIGGTELYNKDDFAEKNLKMNFLKMDGGLSYQQFRDGFVPGLSIIDTLMFNHPSEIQPMLEMYELV